MYCPNCQRKFEENDKFCANCGNAKPNGNRSKLKENARRNGNRKINLPKYSSQNFLIIGLIILFAAPVLILILSPKTDEAIIRIINEENFNRIHEIEECKSKEGCNQIKVIGSKDEEEIYPLKADLKESLVKNRTTTLRLFNENHRNKIVIISLDISGSVVSRNNKTSKSNFSKLYSDTLLEKIKFLLDQGKILNPGDNIIIKLYGPSHLDNPCEEQLHIKYSGPEWKAEFIHSIRTNETLIKVKNELPPKVTQDDYSITTNDKGIVFDLIRDFYNKSLNNPNSSCHSDTFLDEHLTSILDDSQLNLYDEHHYILVNDGEFSFKDYFITSYSYDVLNTFINQGKPFTVNNKVLCRSSQDTFTIVGLDYKGNSRYRQLLQNFFNTILSPCIVSFENA